MNSITTPSMLRFMQERRQVAETGTWAGQGVENLYFQFCRGVHESGAQIIFTRDTGYHTSGWWKNPDYERCYHLSISFWDLANAVPREPERGEREAWVRLFFGPAVNLVWEESAVDPHGKQVGVRHYRVFCDERWRPIKPRGEAYSTELTEAGWKSWSEVQASLQEVA